MRLRPWTFVTKPVSSTGCMHVCARPHIKNTRNKASDKDSMGEVGESVGPTIKRGEVEP